MVAAWQYKVLVVTADRLMRSELGYRYVEQQSKGPVEWAGSPVDDVLGWRIDADPHVWASLDEVLNAHAAVGWELLTVVEAASIVPSAGGIGTVIRYRCILRAPPQPASSP